MKSCFLLCAIAISSCAVAQLLPPPATAEPASLPASFGAYGDTASYVAAVTNSIDRNDALALLQAGDMLYQVSLTEATRLHEAAARLSPSDWQIQMELGYDYTAKGDCKSANYVCLHTR